MLLPGESLYMRAFWTLHTERPTGDQTVGPIPWSKAREYALVEFGRDEPVIEIFWRVIAAMDGGFLLNMKNEHARYVRQSKSGTKGGKQTSRTAYAR